MSEENVVEDAVGTRPLSEDERAALESAEIDPSTVEAQTCSYRMLLDAGVDDELATTLRKRFSLPWSFETDGDLDRRSSEISGLGEAEREWVAASADEGWQAFEAVLSRAAEEERREDVERPWPRPTPVQAVTAVGPDDAAALAEAGINSAERLSTIDAFAVARALELDVIHVRAWRHNARELVGHRPGEAEPDADVDGEDEDVDDEPDADADGEDEDVDDESDADADGEDEDVDDEPDADVDGEGEGVVGKDEGGDTNAPEDV